MSHWVEIPASALPASGGRGLFRHAGRCVLLVNVDGTLFALDDSCPHAGASLFGGKLDGRFIQCPAHGLRFDLASGCLAGRRDLGVARYPLEWRGDACFIDLSESTFQVPTP
ncbi:Rieske (2Fe-2S) protein [Zestomonas carbonaria]|uniref:Naphthalene 1,2-dioxygenase system, ferredoxin component n=1 Tax=Zestomonas carbonaria TaxID=2762745 RepID=A0A7U7I8R8_9GAMM|nr:Rieske 2Fe-2S domain-containing protein [Pseudomonas carbonaria]CAD5107441.1 Naphthalene 1,2-dioxygenase system, ferredoxin component [Pseudomonas carbonaria]